MAKYDKDDGAELTYAFVTLVLIAIMAVAGFALKQIIDVHVRYNAFMGWFLAADCAWLVAIVLAIVIGGSTGAWLGVVATVVLVLGFIFTKLILDDLEQREAPDLTLDDVLYKRS